MLGKKCCPECGAELEEVLLTQGLWDMDGELYYVCPKKCDRGKENQKNSSAVPARQKRKSGFGFCK